MRAATGSSDQRMRFITCFRMIVPTQSGKGDVPVRTPCGGAVGVDGVGVLRLRNNFASRSSCCAEDDIFFESDQDGIRKCQSVACS
jgi:hypothetical protein